MNKKLLAQTALILAVCLITLTFFNIYNQKSNKNFSNNLATKDQDNKKEDLKNKEGTIEGIEYFSQDINGNTYIIKAKSGVIDKENPDIINLLNVEAELKFENNEVIKVNSNNAIYNNNNYDTIFTENVIINYNDHKINCNKLEAKFSENEAILSQSLIYENLSTKLFADQMKVDLIKKNTEITMFNQKEKVKITHKK